jgi:hypothetical protein
MPSGGWLLFADIVEKAVKYSSDGKSSRCFGDGGRVVWAAPGPPSWALWGQHYRKHIHRPQSGESSQILGGSREEKFVVGPVRTS